MMKQFKYNVRAAVFHKGKLLVMRRALSDKAYAGYWSLPGGCVDEGETLPEALHRELKEETALEGLSVQNEDYYHFIYGRENHIKDAHYMASCDDISGMYIHPDEHGDHKWITCVSQLDAINADITPEMRESMVAALKTFSA